MPIELGVGGLVDLAHAPLADEGGDAAVRDAVTYGEGHGVLLPSTLQRNHDVRIRRVGPHHPRATIQVVCRNLFEHLWVANW